MKTEVDKDLCIGCALCVQICPEVFVAEGDKAIVSASVVPEEAENSCKQAADDCPVNAIKIHRKRN